ncbi:hypothetical protein E1N52_41970 [Paraburkholderia guartelaensis]|uniref:Uncharacterized protein n=1 Tax=Paraburkholderia guartelaensis TaxID=2546446 RepID=A0A4R5L3G9_9BURK|nr:hypothetical protein [Paraburkholderia guartelaensis]TDG02025.1 hypothetical protein E1N52_41970 [Paraburkholderia guartelaensis]
MLEKLYRIILEFSEISLKAKSKFTFFPADDAPNLVRAAVLVYWIVFLVFFIQFFIQVGVPPFNTHKEIEGAATVFGLLSAVLIFYALTIMRLSDGKRWARNVALFSTSLGIIVTGYSLFSHGLLSEKNNVVGVISVAANIVASLFLLTSKSTAWFKSRVE